MKTPVRRLVSIGKAIRENANDMRQLTDVDMLQQRTSGLCLTERPTDRPTGLYHRPLPVPPHFETVTEKRQSWRGLAWGADDIIPSSRSLAFYRAKPVGCQVMAHPVQCHAAVGVPGRNAVWIYIQLCRPVCGHRSASTRRARRRRSAHATSKDACTLVRRYGPPPSLSEMYRCTSE